MKSKLQIISGVVVIASALAQLSCAGGKIQDEVNPVPSVTAISPASVTAGASGVTLTVSGMNFIPASVVRWNGSGRATTFVSNSQLTAVISAADVATASTASVVVFTPNPGGGTSNAAAFAINNPAPVVSALSPSSATAGGTAFMLTVDGSNFVPTSVVRWNGNSKPTTFVSSSRLTTAIASSEVASAGTAPVTVFNPEPGGGTANAAAFAINNPAPVVSALSPSSATAGGTAFTLTVSGSNFVSSSVVRWNGSDRPTRFVSSTQLTADILPSDIASQGAGQVTVSTPAPGGGSSNDMNFTVTAPGPVISSVSPTWITAGGPGFTLTVNGSNFTSTSVVRWNGSDRSTTFVSSTQLTADILPSDIAFAWTPGVWVDNPGGYPTSNGVTFEVRNPIPVLTSLSSAGAIAGDPPMTLTVTGSNFVWGAVVRWNGSDRSTTFVDETRLDAQIPATDLAAEGSAQVTGANPLSGGGASPPLTFSIAARTSYPLPAIVSASDAKAPAAWPGFALTLTGSGFVAASVVQWNGLNRPTTVLSSTELRAAIPPEDLASASTAQVAVFNPSPDGGTSNAIDFTVYAVAPNAVGVIDRASVGDGFAPGDSHSWQPAVSADGRYVAFASEASNLVSGDTNGVSDIFLRDTCLGAPPGCTPSVIRVSVNWNDQFYLHTSQPSISATGRYVAFVYYDYDWDWDQENDEIYVRDTCIGAPAGCAPWNEWVATTPYNYEITIVGLSLSAGGRYVAYSYAYSWDLPGVLHAAVADTCMGVPSGCQQWNPLELPDQVTDPVLSADGRFAVFVSDRTDLVPNDTNSASDVFLYDTCRGAAAGCTPSTIRVSVDSNGNEGDGASFLGTISGDGRFVAFTSSATNLVPGDTNGREDVFLRDTCIGAAAGCTPSTIRISVADNGSEADAPSFRASLSANGRYVAFDSDATILVAGDTNGASDVFVRDTCLGAPSGCTPSTVRVSVALDGTEDVVGSNFPRITADGRYVVFESLTMRLAPGNGSAVFNVFVARTGRP